MSEYLNTCLNKGSTSDPKTDLKAIEYRCLEPSQANSFPHPPRGYEGSGSGSGLPPPSLAGSGTSQFPSNTAQFQEKVHLDFTSNGLVGGVDMSTYLTQMSMGNNNINFDHTNLNTQTNNNTNNNNFYPNGGNEAHISPFSYNNPLSNNSGTSSYASSRNFSGSSKTTPESSGLVEPQPYFDNSNVNGNVNGNGNGKGSSGAVDGMGYMIYGQEEQGQTQTRFGQMERYFDTIPNQDSKMY